MIGPNSPIDIGRFRTGKSGHSVPLSGTRVAGNACR